MPLRLAIFDFDQTLSVFHVYNTLAGGHDGWRIPPPHARTEVGQLALLAELDKKPEIHRQGGFATAAFGGMRRVTQLTSVLEQLSQSGVECIICSRGLVAVIQKLLDQLGLLRFFSQVYGNIGDTYGRSSYDSQHSPTSLGADARYLGTPEQSGWGSKNRCVERALMARGLTAEEAIFIDDQSSEIKSMQGVCPTIQVQPPQGIGRKEVEALLKLVQEAAGADSFQEATSEPPVMKTPQYQQSSRVAPSPGASPTRRGPAVAEDARPGEGVPVRGAAPALAQQRSFLMYSESSPFTGPMPGAADDVSFVRPMQNVWQQMDEGKSPESKGTKKRKDDKNKQGRPIWCCQQ